MLKIEQHDDNTVAINGVLYVPLSDTTGLCTVREWAEALLEEWSDDGPGNAKTSSDVQAQMGVPGGEMTFEHNGRRYNVETVVTRVEDETFTFGEMREAYRKFVMGEPLTEKEKQLAAARALAAKLACES